jgi:hypothetical protein
MNKQKGYDVPIMGILCNGTNLFFYKFIDKHHTIGPRLCLGKFPNGGTGLSIDDMSIGGVADPETFYRSLRRTCDTLYYVFFSGYYSGIEAYWKQSVELEKQIGNGKKSSSAWDKATFSARIALHEATYAWDLYNKGRAEESEQSAKTAAEFLAERYILCCPSCYNEC